MNPAADLRATAAQYAAIAAGAGLCSDARALVAARLSDVLMTTNLDDLVPVMHQTLGTSSEFAVVPQGFAAWAHHIATGDTELANAWWPLLTTWISTETLNAAILALPRFMTAYQSLIAMPPTEAVQ